MQVNAVLGEDATARQNARHAIDRMVRRSRQRPPGDAVKLVDDARTALGSRG
jgi:hypothetical protein